jgi:hypothetical protein
MDVKEMIVKHFDVLYVLFATKAQRTEGIYCANRKYTIYSLSNIAE